MKKFEEELKRGFTDSDEDDVIYCPVGGIPDDPIAGIDGGDLVISREEMKAIFDPVIDKIIPLVKNQVSNVEAKSSQGLRLTVCEHKIPSRHSNFIILIYQDVVYTPCRGLRELQISIKTA